MKRVRLLQRLLQVVIVLSLCTACTLPQVSAEQRIFLDLSLDFLGEYRLSPETTFSDQPIGRLSGITYQLQGYGDSTPSGTYFYGVSQESDQSNSVQVYTLKSDLNTPASDSNQIQSMTVEAVTVLKDQSGQPLPDQTIHPESIVFSPRESVFIAAEEVNDNGSLPLIGEFDLKTGQLKNTVPLPPNYRPPEDDEQEPQGIQPNLGFRSMTIAPDGFSMGGLDPFRLFTSTEAPLFQDLDADATQLRLLHYVIADRASFLISENLYPLEPKPEMGSAYHLAEIIALPESGHFLSLERSRSVPSGVSPTPSAYHAKIYQLFTGNATDTSRIASLRGQLSIVQPLHKKLLLDLNELGIPLQRLDGMTLGPKLPEGGQSLILMSNDTDDTASATQFLLFSLKQEA